MNIFSRLDNLTDLTTNEQTLVDYMKNRKAKRRFFLPLKFEEPCG